MSKYPIQYYSESKRQNIDIEDMPSPHIANALRKLESDPDAKPVRRAMWEELESRGCIYDTETGQWAFLPKPEVTP